MQVDEHAMLVALRNAVFRSDDQRLDAADIGGLHFHRVARLLFVDQRRQVRVDVGALLGDVGIGRRIGMQQAVGDVGLGLGTEKARQRHGLRRDVYRAVGINLDARRGGIGVNLRGRADGEGAQHHNSGKRQHKKATEANGSIGSRHAEHYSSKAARRDTYPNRQQVEIGRRFENFLVLSLVSSA